MAGILTRIQKRIYVIRGKRVMLDRDLAYLYEVEVKQLNQAIKRNIKRFPVDFMFRLTINELSKVVTNCDHLQNLKYRPTLPYAFTEQGVAMLAAVLNSQKAIDVNINIMRAFVKLRRYVLSQNKDEQIAELRKLLMLHIENNDYKFSEYDETIKQIIIALNNLIEQPKESKKIGFRAKN